MLNRFGYNDFRRALDNTPFLYSSLEKTALTIDFFSVVFGFVITPDMSMQQLMDETVK
jgi:hypothetical protein